MGAVDQLLPPSTEVSLGSMFEDIFSSCFDCFFFRLTHGKNSGESNWLPTGGILCHGIRNTSRHQNGREGLLVSLENGKRMKKTEFSCGGRGMGRSGRASLKHTQGFYHRNSEARVSNGWLEGGKAKI